MGHCAVCLSTTADVISRIAFQSSEWQKLRIQRIIEKHLWWWYMKQQSPDDSTPWICHLCWQELSNFHRFCLRIEKAHKQYDLLRGKVSNDSIGDNVKGTLLLVKEEYKLTDDYTPQTLREDLVSLEELKSNVGKKTSSLTNANIEIEELPAIIVKDEHLSANSEDEDITNDMDSDSLDNWKPSLKEDFNNDENDKVLKTKPTKKSRNKVTKTPRRKKQDKVNTTTKSEVTRKNDEYLAQSEYKLICHLCDIPLKDFLTLKNHYRLEHQTTGYAMCCNTKFYIRGLLVDHLRVHENPEYFKCKLCDRILLHRSTLENHKKFHQKETRERKFSCDKCDRSFFNKAGYDRHILSHVPEEERIFPCDECDRKFATERLVAQHKAFCHQNKYGKFCDICGKSFRERFSFERHMAEHNGTPVEKVPCDICGFELTNKYLLNRHKKKLHSDENQEQICPYCSKVSPNMHAHRQHIKYTHTAERKHACHLCEKKFKHARHLKEHISTHTGEPLYTCLYCPQTFISNSNMHKHRKMAHPKEWASSHAAALRKIHCSKTKRSND